jgi:protoheme IX farnesyltransferase
MLPVVAAPRAVGRQIIIYSWVMIATSLVLIPVAGMGIVYSAAAVVLGAIFLFEAYALSARLRKGDVPIKPMRLFHYSITYLALLFLVVATDPFLP